MNIVIIIVAILIAVFECVKGIAEEESSRKRRLSFLIASLAVVFIVLSGIASCQSEKMETEARKASSESLKAITNDLQSANALTETLNRPEVLIVEGIVMRAGDNKNYHIPVKNFGKMTATDVSLTIDYLVPDAVLFGKRIRQMTPGKEESFLVPFMPREFIEPLHDDWPPKQLKEFMDQYNKKKAKIYIKLHLEYKWDERTYRSRDYLLTHEMPNVVTLWPM